MTKKGIHWGIPCLRVNCLSFPQSSGYNHFTSMRNPYLSDKKKRKQNKTSSSCMTQKGQRGPEAKREQTWNLHSSPVSEPQLHCAGSHCLCPAANSSECSHRPNNKMTFMSHTYYRGQKPRRRKKEGEKYATILLLFDEHLSKTPGKH